MSEPKRKYDSTVARIAGNIASGFIGFDPQHESYTHTPEHRDAVAVVAVDLARAIVAEVERTEPKAGE